MVKEGGEIDVLIVIRIHKAAEYVAKGSLLSSSSAAAAAAAAASSSSSSSNAVGARDFQKKSKGRVTRTTPFDVVS